MFLTHLIQTQCGKILLKVACLLMIFVFYPFCLLECTSIPSIAIQNGSIILSARKRRCPIIMDGHFVFGTTKIQGKCILTSFIGLGGNNFLFFLDLPMYLILVAFTSIYVLYILRRKFLALFSEQLSSFFILKQTLIIKHLVNKHFINGVLQDEIKVLLRS